jgi:hypothetical protein
MGLMTKIVAWRAKRQAKRAARNRTKGVKKMFGGK